MAGAMSDAEFHQLVGKHNQQCTGLTVPMYDVERFVQEVILDRARLIEEVARLRGLPSSRGPLAEPAQAERGGA